MDITTIVICALAFVVLSKILKWSAKTILKIGFVIAVAYIIFM